MAALTMTVKTTFVAGVLLYAGALWAAGLRRFLRAPLPWRRKHVWTALLVVAGVVVGAILPAAQLWNKFLLVLVLLPLLAGADVILVRSGRGFGYWLQACGFEVVTVFAAAAVARVSIDW